MQIPTITQFNQWTPKERLNWINLETAGKYKKLTRKKGYCPAIFYKAENVGIIYTVDSRGNLEKAEAMTVKDALDRVSRYMTAADAVNMRSRFN
jgi:hypothetical protein